MSNSKAKLITLIGGTAAVALYSLFSGTDELKAQLYGNDADKYDISLEAHANPESLETVLIADLESHQQDKTKQNTTQQNTTQQKNTTTTSQQNDTQTATQQIDRQQQIAAHVQTPPQPTLYKGVEVMPLRTFGNAKLVGIVDNPLQYNKSGWASYNARGLLFQLNDTLLNLIGPDYPFYTNQRYDISFHLFKPGVIIKTPQMLEMLSGVQGATTPITNHYSGRYDGILVTGTLSRKISKVVK